MARRQESDLEGVGYILGGVKLPKTVKDRLKNKELWTKWNEIVGAELSRVTEPAELRGKTLEIKVAHQAWAQQLHFLTPSILGKIKAVCPYAKIEELQFKVGKIEATKPAAEPWKPPTKKIPLSERMEMTLRAVNDPDLRASIRKAMEAEAARSVQSA